MNKNLIAQTEVTINAAPRKVWEALVDPAAIKQYMFGTQVKSDWREGSPITWQGEWQGKPYEDKGKIIKVQPARSLAYTHYSGMSGQPDQPENYHTVTIDLAGEAEGKRTHVSLTQDKNDSEQARAESQKTWEAMLNALKKYLEQSSAS